MTGNNDRDQDRLSSKGKAVLIALAIIVWFVVISTTMGIANGLTGPSEFPTEITTEIGTALTMDNLPECWEDEVIVLVVWDPYGDLDETDTLGCVPADNLPVTGYRP